MTPRKQAGSHPLPSEQIYAEFGRKVDCDMVIYGNNYADLVESKLESALGLYNINNGNLANELIKNYCHACGRMGSGHRANWERCHFLYYLIGSTVGGKLCDNRFSTVMGKIYQILGKYPDVCECNDIYPTISWDIFTRRKKIFDYKYDLKKLEEKPDKEKCAFKEQLDKNLKEAQSAYDKLVTMCGGDDTGNLYCKEFKEPNKQEKSQMIQELKCSAPPAEPERAQVSLQGARMETAATVEEGKGGSDGRGSHRKEGEEADSPGVAPAAVSGGLAAIGIPAVFFFLYKYTNVFSGLGGNLSGRSTGRSRKKRKSTIRQGLNAFSGDDSSTEYSRTNLTESVMGTDSATEYSIPYTSSSR